LNEFEGEDFVEIIENLKIGLQIKQEDYEGFKKMQEAKDYEGMKKLILKL